MKLLFQPLRQPNRSLVSGVPTHYCEIRPRDEAIFLLHIGAEIEHSLMVEISLCCLFIRSELGDRG